MFTDKELEFIKMVISQVTFRAGQSEQMIMSEQIIKKITEKQNKGK